MDKDGALENSTYVTNLLVDDFRISMETSGGYSSFLNGKNKRHSRGICNMVVAVLIKSTSSVYADIGIWIICCEKIFCEIDKTCVHIFVPNTHLIKHKNG